MNHYQSCYKEANVSIQPAAQVSKNERDKKARKTLIKLYKNRERQQGEPENTSQEVEPPQPEIK
jgi:hypothetical protein